MTKMTLQEDKHLIRLVCAGLLGTQLVVLVLMLSLAYPFVSTMNEMTRQFPQTMESLKKNKDENLVLLEKDVQAIKASLEEVKGAMKKIELMPITTMTHLNEELVSTNKDIAWITDNVMNMRRKTEKYLATVPLMESSITHLYEEFSTMNSEIKKIETKLSSTRESLNCSLTTFGEGFIPFNGYPYQGETRFIPSKDFKK